jgi:hypothetical protein
MNRPEFSLNIGLGRSAKAANRPPRRFNPAKA